MPRHMGVGITCLLLLVTLSSPAAAVTDADILTFALNLEYLEATFYSWVAYGHGLSVEDRGGGPASIGGRVGDLSPEALQYASDLASDEVTHVRYLRAALKFAGAPVQPAPLIDVGPAFTLALNLALSGDTFPAFNPYDADFLFYLGAYIFEDVGVTAYHGAVPLITNLDYAEVAAGILGTEAYHAGAIRQKLIQIKDQYTFPYKNIVKNIAGGISALRQAAGNVTDQGIVAEDGSIIIVPADSNALPFSRSTSSVLKIVYLGGDKNGGFFPQGLNGLIK